MTTKYVKYLSLTWTLYLPTRQWVVVYYYFIAKMITVFTNLSVDPWTKPPEPCQCWTSPWPRRNRPWRLLCRRGGRCRACRRRRCRTRCSRPWWKSSCRQALNLQFNHIKLKRVNRNKDKQLKEQVLERSADGCDGWSYELSQCFQKSSFY